jgi:choline-sulfatase
MADMQRPNILFLTNDQHRFDAYGHLGTWGDLTTPTIDRLAAEGTTYRNAVATCPICVPNRFVWNHGLQPSQAAGGMLFNAADWPMVPTLPGALQKSGYRTALIGKLHSEHGDLDTDAHRENTHARGFEGVYEVGGRSIAFRRHCRWTRHLEARGLLERYRADIEDRTAHRCWNEPYRASVLPYDDQMDVFIRRDAEK